MRAARSITASLILLAASGFAVAACVGDDDPAVNPLDLPDASTTLPPDASPDATLEPDATPDATPDASPDATPDGPVIVGCVPQEISTRYDATWLFGHGCRADWDTSNDVTFAATAVTFSGIEGTISAANALTGALFAASDGVDLYDGTLTKTNDASLGANTSASQPVAFLGKPGSAADFFVIANAGDADGAGAGGLYVSELECGDVAPIGPPTLIPDTTAYTEALATVRHANTVDRWILAAAPTGLAALLVTSTSIGTPVITPWGAALATLSPRQRAFIAIARDRHTFALTAENVGAIVGTFDPATGTASNLTSITLPAHSTLYSAAFSADQSKLYFSEWNGKYWQVDLADGNAVVELGAASGALRLAIDDKIYLAGTGASSLTVIENPNEPAAQLTIGSVSLPGGCSSTYGLPGVGDL